MIRDIVNKTEFDEIVRAENFVIVDFWATWCGPCRMMGTVLDEYANENPDVAVIKVNVDEAQELASEYDINSLPTLMIFKSGNEVTSKVGFISKSVLAKFIEDNR